MVILKLIFHIVRMKRGISLTVPGIKIKKYVLCGKKLIIHSDEIILEKYTNRIDKNAMCLSLSFLGLKTKTRI